MHIVMKKYRTKSYRYPVLTKTVKANCFNNKLHNFCNLNLETNTMNSPSTTTLKIIWMIQVGALLLVAVQSSLLTKLSQTINALPAKNTTALLVNVNFTTVFHVNNTRDMQI